MRIGYRLLLLLFVQRNLLFCHLSASGEHFIAMLGQIGKYYILNQLVGVVLHGKTEMAIA